MGGFLDVGLVLGKRADARNAQEGLEAFEETVLILGVVLEWRRHVFTLSDRAAPIAASRYGLLKHERQGTTLTSG
jgi:hypothetical protein